MTSQEFLEQFGTLAEAEGGVAQMRELVLDLAVRGELVAQDKDDESVEVILELAAEEQASLVKNKRLRKQDTVPNPDGTALPYVVPESWAVVAIGNVAQIIRGVTFPASDKSKIKEPSTVACLRTASVQDEIDWDDLIYIPEDRVKRDDQWVQVNDLIISMANSYDLVGKLAQVKEVPEKATFGGFIAAIRPFSLDPTFLLWALRSPLMQLAFRSSSSQTTNIANISLSGMRPLPIGIPPLAEQKRIVAKVDELMALCDRLEAAQQQKQQVRVKLNQASLAPLTTTSSRSDVTSAWNRLSDQFELLYNTPETLTDLRQTILQLAVQGKLVRQDPKDEPAEELKQRILKDHAELISQSRITNTKKVAGTEESDKPFVIPPSWEWMRFGQFGVLVGGGTPSKQCPEFWEGNIPWISPKDMKRRYIEDSIDHITEAAIDESSVKRIPTNSLLFVVRGMILAHSFPVALSKREVTTNQDMKSLWIATPSLAEWLLFVCEGSRDRMLSNVQRSGHGTCRIESDSVCEFLIPLPPLSEQKRIVTKVNQLQSLLDRLESTLTHREATRTQLLTAAIHAILGEQNEHC